MFSLVDLINRICGVYTCRLQDAQEFDGDDVPGSIRKLMNAGETFYEKYGFIWSIGASNHSLKNINRQLEISNRINVALQEVLHGPPRAIQSVLENLRLEWVSALVEEGMADQESRRWYNILIPSHVANKLKTSDWYKTKDMGFPMQWNGEKTLREDVLIFQPILAFDKLSSIQRELSNQAVFVRPVGAGVASTQLLDCAKRSEDYVKILEKLISWVDKAINAAKKLMKVKKMASASDPIKNLVDAPGKNYSLVTFLTTLTRLEYFQKYYKSTSGEVVKGPTAYHLTQLDCPVLSDQNTRKRQRSDRN